MAAHTSHEILQVPFSSLRFENFVVAFQGRILALQRFRFDVRLVYYESMIEWETKHQIENSPQQ